ncbi:MAG: SNF2-related protein [Bacteroidales bacterium]|nr:SNF2-related protein [Bacteroidales bacterium]
MNGYNYMIIDNKHDLSSKEIRENITVWDYLTKNTRDGVFDSVTGFFSVKALSQIWQNLNTPSLFNMILGRMVRPEDLEIATADLINDSSNLSNGLTLNFDAQNAIKFLEQEKVKVKAFTDAFCHAKTYIYHDNDPDKSYFVIGSANLTNPGLGISGSKNVELNLAHKNAEHSDFKDIKNWFELIWDESTIDTLQLKKNGKIDIIQIKQYIIDKIKEMFRYYKPIEIYFKMLYEMFKKDLEALNDKHLAGEITRLEQTQIYHTLFNYQRKGAKSLIRMLFNYNGAILADAVGLGKTYTALAVIKYYELGGYTTLVLCPKKLKENWTQYQSHQGSKFEEDDFRYEVRFHTDLQDDNYDGVKRSRFDKYERFHLDYIKRQQKLLIVIDESHNLRNDQSGRYKYLENQLLSNPDTDIKILELSATPINNHILDVRNQFKLFVRGKNDGFAKIEDFKITSLESLFKTAQHEIDKWQNEKNRTIKSLIEKLSDQFFNLTDKLVVARTRKMIQNSIGGLTFPKKNSPINYFVNTANIGEYKTVADIHNALLNCKLTAYRPYQYTYDAINLRNKKNKDKKNKKQEQNENEDKAIRENFLVKMMMILFLKRFESSWYSCKKTIDNVLLQHKNALDKVNKFIENKDPNLTLDPEDENVGNEDENIDVTIGKNKPIKLKDIDIDTFKKDLIADIDYLTNFCNNLSDYSDKFTKNQVADDKLELLKTLLTKKQAEKKKVLIFTTYADTAQYLYDNLKTQFPSIAKIDGKGAVFNNKETKIKTVLERFSPYSKIHNEYNWNDLYKEHLEPQFFNKGDNKWNVSFDVWFNLIKTYKPELYDHYVNQIDILIATDCMSEGQNLQDAQTVVNYDVHWNPVRIIQRVGRIDRIGSKNEVIDCVNFWPGKDLESYLKLNVRVKDRMSTMGIMGTETADIDNDLQNILNDNPIFDKNQEKLLRELENNIDDAETPDDQPGLHNFSLEEFREELLEFLGNKKEELEAMPLGCYSIFDTNAPIIGHIQDDSLIAMIARPTNANNDINHEYKEFKFIVRPINRDNNVLPLYDMPNKQQTLNILRKYKDNARGINEKLDNGDKDELNLLHHVLVDYMTSQNTITKEAETDLLKLLSGDFSAIENNTNNQTIEEQLSPNQWDIIAWNYVNNLK